MNYIIINDANPKGRAEGLSRELFKLSRPDSVRNENDVTQYLFGWIEHPTDGRVALQVDLDFEIPIHPSQNGEALGRALKDDIGDEEVTKLRNAVVGNNRIKFGNFLPSVYTVSTREELEADGWFQTEEVI